LKTKINVHYISSCGVSRAPNTLHLDDKIRSLNAVLRNDRCLICEQCKTRKCIMWAQC